MNPDSFPSTGPSAGAQRRVGFRCDVAPHRGIGHVMRSLALAEELSSRGWEVEFCCAAADVPFAREQIESRGYALDPAVWTAAEHTDWAGRRRLDLVVFDSYDLPADVYRAVRGDVATAAFVDGELRGAVADLLIDQNLGSEDDEPFLEPGVRRLAGLQYAMFRSDLLSWRPAGEPDGARRHDPPKILAFFGGTDPFGAAEVCARLLTGVHLPYAATIVASDDHRDDVTAVAAGLDRDRSIDVIGPTGRLPELVADADLVLAASGTSSWELMCCGAVAGLVCVIDNQELGYQRVVATGAADGIGMLSALRDDPWAAVPTVEALLRDPERRRELASAGWRLVDGRGRVRVADALAELIDRRRLSVD